MAIRSKTIFNKADTIRIINGINELPNPRKTALQTLYSIFPKEPSIIIIKYEVASFIICGGTFISRVKYEAKKKPNRDKQIEKKEKKIVYLRNSEDILDIIFLTGAVNSFFAFEEVTINKE